MDTNTLHWILILVTALFLGSIPYNFNTFRYWFVMVVGTLIQVHFWAVVIGMENAFNALLNIFSGVLLFGGICIVIGIGQGIYSFGREIYMKLNNK